MTAAAADDEALYDILLDAEAQARRWINDPANAPAVFRGVPVRLVPDALYQTLNLQGQVRPSLVVTANGLSFCCLRRTDAVVWPRLYCDRLRNAVIQAVIRCAYEVLRLSERRGAAADAAGRLGKLDPRAAALSPAALQSVEIAGDILSAGRRGASGEWDVWTVICEDPSATNVSSVPTCDRTRVCSNADPRRDQGHLVGEFHSHPEHDPRHVKPMFDFDLYQLTIAAANGVHSCTAIITYEGAYWCAASGLTLRQLLPDITRYYERHGYTVAARRKSMRQCRQPIVANVTPDLVHLYGLLQGLRQEYKVLMQSAAYTEQTDLARRFFARLEQHGYSALFVGWVKHPRKWKHAADARLGPQVVATRQPTR